MPKEDKIIRDIVARYDKDVGMLIPMMQDLQTEYGYLPAEQLRRLSKELDVPLTRIYGAATFYASFRLVPKGEHIITLCLGTVCYLKGSNKISEAIQQEFQVSPGGTSPDGKFTFSPVNCLGACALAPVMTVDSEYYGGLTVESAIETLRKIAAAQSAKPEAAESVPLSAVAEKPRRKRKK